MADDSQSVIWASIDNSRAFSGDGLTATRACPVCGCDDYRPVTAPMDFQFYTDSPETPKRTRVVQCQCLGCFAVFMNPRYTRTGVASLFAEAGMSYGAGESRATEKVEWAAERGLLKPGAIVLELGCYDGAFLSRLPSHTRRVGVDIDKAATDRGRQVHGPSGIEFVCGDFADFEYSEHPDVMMMFMVLEHLHNPFEVLAKLRSIASTDSRLVVEVPILEDGATNDVVGFLSIMHMTHFSRASLANVLGRAGWSTLEWHEADGFNRCKVLAEPGTPRDPVGESRDISILCRLLASDYAATADVEDRIAALSDYSHVAVWGAGLHTETLYQRTSLFCERNRLFTIVDSDSLKQGSTWRGIPIQSPSALTSIDWEKTPLLISTYGDQEEVAHAALDLGVPSTAIVRLYDYCRYR